MSCLVRSENRMRWDVLIACARGTPASMFWLITIMKLDYHGLGTWDVLRNLHVYLMCGLKFSLFFRNNFFPNFLDEHFVRCRASHVWAQAFCYVARCLISLLWLMKHVG